jgi:hypothetical protein
MNNLRILLSFIFIGWFSGPVISQFAIRAGANYSDISIDGSSITTETDAKAGYHAGLMYTFGLADRISIRPGVLFSTKGYKIHEESINLQYVEVPLSFLFYLGSNKNGFYLEAGPYAGTGIESDIGDFGDDLKRLDLGLNIGLGFQLGRFGIGLNYGLGVANILEGEINTQEKARNKNYSLYGYIEF